MFGIRTAADHPVVALDVGTASTRMYLRGSGVVVDRPSGADRSTLFDSGDDYHLSSKADVCNSKERDDCRPILAGLVYDFEATVSLIHPILQRVRHAGPAGPKVLVSAPSSAQEGDRERLVRAVQESNGACVAVIPDPLAAALGAGMDAYSRYAQMVIDIGAGVTDIAIIRSGLIAAAATTLQACAEFQDSLIQTLIDRRGIVLSDREAERLVHELGAAPDFSFDARSTAVGIELGNGRVTSVTIQSDEVSSAIAPTLYSIADRITNLLRGMPDQIAREVIESAVYLTGGGALLRGISEFLAAKTGLEVRAAHHPMHAVIHGIGLMSEQGFRQDPWPQQCC